MDVARASFESTNRKFMVMDAPGHRDFIPNMISGAAQADVALLVINATRGEFETGFDQGGQTREHALLLRLDFKELLAILYPQQVIGRKSRCSSDQQAGYYRMVRGALQ